MKRAYKLTFVLASLLALASCEDPEPTIYNGGTNDDAFVAFTNSVYSLPVIRDEEGSVEITLQASTISNADRTYTLAIDEEASTADPSIYTFPASVTIPAGEYEASVVVEAVDEGVTATNQTIVFSISNLVEGTEFTDDETVTINIYEVCPLQDEFLGDYVFNQTSGILTSGGNDVTIFEQGGIVTLEAGSNEYERVINSEWFPGIWDQPMTFVINFNCGQTFVPNGDLNGLYCTEDAEGNPIPFEFGQGAIPGTYNTNNDAVITVNVLQDLNSSCLDGSVQASFTLTKAD